MADLQKKGKIRDGHRGLAAKKLAEADQLVDRVKAGVQVEQVELSQIKLALVERLKTLRKLDEEIIDLIDGDQVVKEIEDSDAFNEELANRIVALDHCLQEYKEAGATIRQEGRAKLPKLDLPRFSGDIKEWMTFWDSYTVAVHSNKELSDIERFTYLRSLLTNAAKEAIAGFALTSANYSAAVDLLRTRFGYKDRIITKHMEELINLEVVANHGNTAGLRALYDKMETHMRELRELGVPAETYNYLVPSVLMSKLPNALRLAISRKVPEDEWKLDRLMKELSDELKARERVPIEHRVGTEESSRGRSVMKSIHRREPPSAAALHARAYDCCYCNGEHESDKCVKISSVERRKQFVRENGRCFVCLRRGHISRACRSGRKCAHCQGRHHVSLCGRTNGSSDVTSETNCTGSLNPQASPFRSTSLLSESKGAVLLQTAQAFVVNPDDTHHRLRLRLIFDSGSQRSYISERAKRGLALKTIGKREMNIATFGSNGSQAQRCEVVRVKVETREGKNLAMKVLTIPIICESVPGVSLQKCVPKCAHLRDLTLADDMEEGEQLEFDILVGLDYYWEFVTGEAIHGESGPTAVYSTLGWLISGPVVTETTSLFTHVLTAISQENPNLDMQLQSFWELESLGITEKESTLLEEFETRICFNGTRYEVSLPWKSSTSELSDNYRLSEKRLNSLVKRLRREPRIFTEYDRIIKDQLQQGIIEEVEDPEQTNGNRVHYLPHHAVIRQDKLTTKVRVVYDASAKENGPSLNECLHTGPKFDQNILGLLIRFRVHEYAFTSDIEKAFLMISMQEADRDVLRFLWFQDIYKDPLEIRVFRFARVTFGVGPSPFLLNATLRHHIEQYQGTYSDTAKKLLDSLYVDDVIGGAGSIEQCKQLYEKFREILKKGGFNLRKFVASGTAPEAPGEVNKVLGLNWDVACDEIIMDLRPIIASVDLVAPTKRHIVSVISRIYDPIGIIAPIVIRFKIFLQDLHSAKLGWDSPIGPELQKQWSEIVLSIEQSVPVAIDRYYFSEVGLPVEKFRLCGFSDASLRAYAAVIYLQCLASDGKKHTTLIASKTRVAPLKPHSIPRLELLGALLLARLIETITSTLENEMVLTQPACYSDSLVTLHWIKGVDRNWKPFVENRARQIRRLVPVDCWRFCPGTENPADIPSRGLSMSELGGNELWFHGPSWLTGVGTEETEVIDMNPNIPEECIEELRARERRECGLLSQEVTASDIINVEQYSNLERLLRVTGFVFQFVSHLKRRVLSEREEMSVSCSLVKVEEWWIKQIQSTLAMDSKFKQYKTQFQLFQDQQGIWRCRGRLKNADLPYNTKYPIILPKNHEYTILLIRRCHERVFHNGTKETLTELRAKYWVVGGRSLTRKVIHDCRVCRRAEGSHYGAPEPPPLPSFRVSEEPAFTYTGVDFAGPIYIRDERMCESKTWLCLYTCCVTRAVHLDVLLTMSLESFFRCFRRFVSRRGLPKRVISDNAKTFKGTAKIFKRIMEHKDVENYLEGSKIEWSFNAEKAPWWGGVFERLIKSVKRCLRKVIGRARLSFDELSTIVTEVEMILNSRPLTYVSTEDMEEPITPSHLLIGRRVMSLPDNLCYGSDEEDEDYAVTQEILTKRMKYLGRVMDQFWNRWRSEYLLELREAHRYNAGPQRGTEISVGDVVLVHSDDKRRGFWDLAKIEETITGRDGQIRSALVRIHSTGKRPKFLRRPVQKLYPLEISESNSSNTTIEPFDEPPSTTEENAYRGTTSNVDVVPTDEDKGCRRSKRMAASLARDQILAQSYQ